MRPQCGLRAALTDEASSEERQIPPSSARKRDFEKSESLLLCKSENNRPRVQKHAIYRFIRDAAAGMTVCF